MWSPPQCPVELGLEQSWAGLLKKILIEAIAASIESIFEGIVNNILEQKTSRTHRRGISEPIFMSSFSFLQWATININLFKEYNSVVLVYSQSCATITCVYLRNLFISLRRNPIFTNTHSPSATPSSRPRQPLIYFPSLWICLFRTLHINGIIQYLSFSCLASFT